MSISNVAVATVTSRIPDPQREPYYHFPEWLQSLRLFGVQPTIIGMGAPWHGLISKPKQMRQWLREGHTNADVLIWTDSFDVLFCTHPGELADKYVARWPEGEVVYNAERGLFPRADLAGCFPDLGMPFRYLNSGFIVGRPPDILRILEWMPLDDTPGDCEDPDGTRRIEPNDQGWHQMAYSAQPVRMALDARGVLCQCLSACDLSEFDLSGDRIRNVVTGARPMAFHFNGNSKDLLFEIFARKLGIM